MRNGALGAGGAGAVGAHIAGAEGLLLHLQQRSRPMAAQLDLNPTARANVQGVGCAALLAGVLLAIRGACSKGVRPLVDLGSH